MYCMELLIPESGREGWDYERRRNEKQLFKGQSESRGKAEEKAEPAAESKDFADFFCSKIKLVCAFFFLVPATECVALCC